MDKILKFIENAGAMVRYIPAGTYLHGPKPATRSKVFQNNYNSQEPDYPGPL